MSPRSGQSGSPKKVSGFQTLFPNLDRKTLEKTVDKKTCSKKTWVLTSKIRKSLRHGPEPWQGILRSTASCLEIGAESMVRSACSCDLEIPWFGYSTFWHMSSVSKNRSQRVLDIRSFLQLQSHGGFSESAASALQAQKKQHVKTPSSLQVFCGTEEQAPWATEKASQKVVEVPTLYHERWKT